MYEKLIYASNKSDDRAISVAERRIKHELPKSYKEFCKEHNGAKLRHAKTAPIADSEFGEYEVREFIPIEALGRSNVELWDWDDNLIPIAEDSGGNFFVFKKPDLDAVYFWFHEMDEVEFLCNSFGDFLDLIEEYDMKDVVVDRNARGWIDPDFLKKQKDLGNA